VIGRIDSNFYLPSTTGLSNSKFPITTLGELSLRIIQPTEFTREYVEESENSLPVLRAANIGDGELNLEDLIFIDKSKLQGAKDSFIERGDVLITRTGANAGETCVVRELSRQYVISSHSIRVLPKKDIVIPEFLEGALLSKFGKDQVNRLFTGAAQKQLQLKSVATIQIPIPPLEAQLALVADMESARLARQEKLSQVSDLLKGMDVFVLEQLGLKLPKEEKKSTFAIRFNTVQDSRVDPHFHHPTFRKLIDVIQRVSYEELGQLVKFSHEIWSPERETAEIFRYIEISGVNIQTGNITAIETPVSEAPSRARMMTRNGDILISLTRPHRGAIAQVDKSFDSCIASTGFSIIREITDKRITKDYLWCILRNQISLQQMLQRSSGGNYPAITEPELTKIIIPIPSEKIQEKITSELSHRRAQARALREEAEREWQSAKEKFEKALLNG